MEELALVTVYLPVRERKSQTRNITVNINTVLVLVLLHKNWKKENQTETERTCVSKAEKIGQRKAKAAVGQPHMSLLLQIKAKGHFQCCRFHLCLRRCFQVRAINKADL